MNFRRCILAMVALALFTGLASAQVVVGGNTNQVSGPLICTANVAVPPQLRQEGMTELIGDIVVSCTGGTPLALGSIVPTANFTVSLGTNVTSRLLPVSVASNASEAVLLIDEPNTSANPTQNGVGPTATFQFCGSPNVGAGPGGCVQQVSSGGAGTAASPGAGQSATCSALTATTNCAAAKNVFQGLVSANQVTFLGVPVNPPSTGGFARVFRITNVRANVSALGGGGLSGTTQLLASVSISGSTSLPVANPVLVAGFIQQGLATSLRNTNNTGGGSNVGLAQCSSANNRALGILRYSELFGTAFKVRGEPGTQTVPAQIYNTESGLNMPLLGTTAGVADYGTRLKAVFNSVPAGVRIFVSTTNVLNAATNPTTTVPSAVLVLGEMVPSTGAQGTTISNSQVVVGNNTLLQYEVPIVNGTGTAVWEVTNVNANTLESLDFGLWVTFTANPGANSPPVGTATVNMSYAPTPPVPFSAAAGGSASATLLIPRFADTSSASNIFNITLCQTTLLYPFVTNQFGFDTGIAIANTTTDPFGTRTQAGACTLNWYGASAPPATNTGNIATGTVYTTLASTAAAGFQGYMIAVCNFQLAHGFAFVSDIGARNLAMGYLALVLKTGTGSRNSGDLKHDEGNTIETLTN